MAGIEHDYFGKGTPSGDLYYYIIHPEELPQSFSEQFREKLEISSASDREDPYKEHPNYYELFNSVHFENILHLFLKKIDDQISFQEIRNLVRGSKLLPGGDPKDPEQDFWIIEREKVQTIIDCFHKVNFDEFSDFDEIKPYVEKRFGRPIPNEKIRQNTINWVKRVLNVLIPPLEQGLVILVVWDQS